MKRTLSLFVLAGVLSGLSGCTSGDDNPIDTPQDFPTGTIDWVMVTAPNVVSESSSRTAFELGSSGLSFRWAEQDRIGIFPVTSESESQVRYTIQKGAGTNQARFSGGGWRLRSDIPYISYYPYRETGITFIMGEGIIVPFSFEGQCQTGDASLAHLGAYDLMATAPTMAIDESLNFTFKHLNSFAQINLTLPDATQLSSVRLFCMDKEERIFPTSVDLSLSADSYRCSTTASSNSLQMALCDISTTETSKTVQLYMILPPIDMTGHEVYVSVISADNHAYQGLLQSKNMAAGMAYRFEATLTDVTVNAEVNSPSFTNSSVF